MNHGERTLRTMVLIAAAIAIATYVAVATLRMSYPFELEWMEWCAVQNTERVLDGLPLYTEPSAEFIPGIYPPLYYYISAGAMSLTGVGLFPLRLISFLASLGSIALIFAFVRRETGNRAAGWIAAGLFAATFRMGGAWFDLARVDSLFLFFILLAIWLARLRNERTGAVFAGIAMAAAMLTKQTAAIPAAALFAYLLWRDRKSAILYGVSAFLAAGIPTAILWMQNGSWIPFYWLSVPGAHPYIPKFIVLFWTSGILLPMGISMIITGFYLTHLWKQGMRDRALFYIIVGAGMLMACYFPRIKSGGYDNDSIPAYAFLALLVGAALPQLFGLIQRQDDEVKRAVMPLLWGGLIVQFAALAYDPTDQIPVAADEKAGWELVNKVKLIPGDVWVPYQASVAFHAGKQVFALATPIYDMDDCSNPEVKKRARKDIEQHIASQWNAVVLNDSLFVRNHRRPPYLPMMPAFDTPDVFFPMTGAHTRPEYLYVKQIHEQELSK